MRGDVGEFLQLAVRLFELVSVVAKLALGGFAVGNIARIDDDAVQIDRFVVVAAGDAFDIGALLDQPLERDALIPPDSSPASGNFRKGSLPAGAPGRRR